MPLFRGQFACSALQKFILSIFVLQTFKLDMVGHQVSNTMTTLAGREGSNFDLSG